MFVLPKTRRMGVNTISHQPLVGEWRLMSHGRTQLCLGKGQCQRPVQGPDHGGSCTPTAWGLWPQDWGAAGEQVVVLPPFLPQLCYGMLTHTKGRGCSSAGSLCSLWVMLHWCSSSCFSCVEDWTTSSLLSTKL